MIGPQDWRSGDDGRAAPSFPPALGKLRCPTPEERMTILRLVVAEATRRDYEAVVGILDLDRQHPLGLIMHGAAEVNGKIHVAEVWESEEYARRWDEEHLVPAVKAAGLEKKDEITIIELHHLITP